MNLLILSASLLITGIALANPESTMRRLRGLNAWFMQLDILTALAYGGLSVAFATWFFGFIA